MKKTLMALNDLKKKGVIVDYAIGGGMGAVYYIEPFLTYDLDVFIRTKDESGMQPLAALYSHLKAKGHRPEQEQVIIAGVPVQFLPVYNVLLDEAVKKARLVNYQGTKTRIMTIEHLLAIMLQTGRAKDRERFLKALDEAKIDKVRLSRILKRNGLEGKYREWKGFHDKK